MNWYSKQKGYLLGWLPVSWSNSEGVEEGVEKTVIEMGVHVWIS